MGTTHQFSLAGDGCKRGACRMTRSNATEGYLYRMGMQSRTAVAVWCGSMFLLYLCIPLWLQMSGVCGRDVAVGLYGFPSYWVTFVLVVGIGAVVIVMVNGLNARLCDSRRKWLRKCVDNSIARAESDDVPTTAGSRAADEET